MAAILDKVYEVEINFVIVFERKWKQQSRQETNSAVWIDWSFVP